MHVYSFHYRLMHGVKMLLFLVGTIVHHGILIIEKKILIIVEGKTHGLDNMTIMILYIVTVLSR